MTVDKNHVAIYPYPPYASSALFTVARPVKNAKSDAMKAKLLRPGLEKRDLTVRLRRIKGQIEGIEKMVEADADCSDVLMQVVSARQALKSFSEKVIESQMRACIESTSQAESRHKLRSLLTLLERYAV